MSALDRHLNRGETILLTRHGHWGAIAAALCLVVGGVVLFGIAVLVFVVVSQGQKENGDNPLLVALGFGICFLAVPAVLTGLGGIVAGLSHLFTVFVLTNQRVLVRSGVLTETLEEMPHSRIESIHVGRGFFQGLLGCGSVVVKGVGASALTFDWVHRADEFRLQIQDQLDTIRQGPSQSVGGPPPVPPQLTDQEWYYVLKGKQQGPVSRSQLQQMVQSGQLGRQELVWKQGMANWVPASTVAGLLA